MERKPSSPVVCVGTNTVPILLSDTFPWKDGVILHGPYETIFFNLFENVGKTLEKENLLTAQITRVWISLSTIHVPFEDYDRVMAAYFKALENYSVRWSMADMRHLVPAMACEWVFRLPHDAPIKMVVDAVVSAQSVHNE